MGLSKENNIMIVKGKIGLWGRIHVECPYCHKEHSHNNAKHGDTVQSLCNVGDYTLDCSRISLNVAAPSAITETVKKQNKVIPGRLYKDEWGKWIVIRNKDE